MNDFQNKLLCVHYPGTVKNYDNAIATLGGIDAIKNAFDSNKVPLELIFRLNDVHAKPTRSNKHSVRGYLIKIRFKKKSRAIVSTQVLGSIDAMHKFERLADFQYLPLAPISDAPEDKHKLRSILHELSPSGLPTFEWFSSSKDYFLPPPAFARIDTVQNYTFRVQSSAQSEEPQNLLDCTRKKRYTFAYLIHFNHLGSIPMVPHGEAAKVLSNVQESSVESIRKLFDERPIWSKVELRHVSKLNSNDLKFILPSVAYYFLSGPWRVLWVRLGYDPRKEPAAKIYQNMDFRLRRLKNRLVGNKALSNVATKTNEAKYMFRPGYFPPLKQMFYQYCNIQIPEVQDILTKLGDVLPGALCHEKRGWLPVGFDDKCREFMMKHICKAFGNELSALNDTNMDDDEDDENDDDIAEEMDDYDSDEV